jgi:hypothetical protein
MLTFGSDLQHLGDALPARRGGPLEAELALAVRVAGGRF